MQRTDRFRLVGGAFAAALLAASVLAFAPAPADSPKEEKIAFTTVSGEDKPAAIALMNPDGSKRTTLIKGEANEIEPALSADGKQIVYVTIRLNPQLTGDVWVMKADGSDRKRLTNNAAGTLPFAPSWSPNGKKIAFADASVGSGQQMIDSDVKVMDADGKNVRTIGEGDDAVLVARRQETPVHGPR